MYVYIILFCSKGAPQGIKIQYELQPCSSLLLFLFAQRNPVDKKKKKTVTF